MASTPFLNIWCTNRSYRCECCCQEVEYVVSVRGARLISTGKPRHNTLYVFLQPQLHPGIISAPVLVPVPSCLQVSWREQKLASLICFLCLLVHLSLVSIRSYFSSSFGLGKTNKRHSAKSDSVLNNSNNNLFTFFMKCIHFVPRSPEIKLVIYSEPCNGIPIFIGFYVYSITYL